MCLEVEMLMMIDGLHTGKKMKGHKKQNMTTPKLQ
jgi:hypothetical protein